MSEVKVQSKLQDGTLIRHKVVGYEGRIDGITQIKGCFTAGGKLLDKPNSKEAFQYRVEIKGEPMRQIAPAEDLEVLEGVVKIACPHCRFSFETRPGFTDKPAGRCECGGWICPSCLECRGGNAEASCAKQKRRLARKLALQKKRGVV